MGEQPDQRTERSFQAVAEIGGQLGRDRTGQRVGDGQHLPEFLISHPPVPGDGLVPDEGDGRRTAAIPENSGPEHGEG